jgi:hypothetical protein
LDLRTTASRLNDYRGKHLLNPSLFLFRPEAVSSQFNNPHLNLPDFQARNSEQMVSEFVASQAKPARLFRR